MKEKSIKNAAVLVASGVAVVLIIVAIIAASVSTPKKTISKMESAINSRSIEDYIECFSPELREQLDEYIEAQKEFFGEEQVAQSVFSEFAYDDEGNEIDLENFKVNFDVTKVETKGDTATATIDIDYKDSGKTVREESVTVDLVKVDGKWYLNEL